MFRKVYTANTVRNGEVVGSIVAIVWFWVTAYKAWDAVNAFAAENNAKICDFRRVK